MSAGFLLIIPAAFILLGGALARAGMAGRRAALDFKRRAVEVEAEVTGVRSEWRRMGAEHRQKQFYFPTLRFTGPNGATIEVEAQTGSNPPPGREGERVTALYLPEDPRSVRVAGPLSDGTLATGCITTIGGVFLAIGALLLVAIVIAALAG